MKRVKMWWINLLSLCVVVVLVLPASQGNLGQTVVDRAQGPQCMEFTHPYCSQLNYTTAVFPNPRGHETPEEAASEFSDFNGLLQTGCHPKLGTLLCFLYFPYCNKAIYNSNTPLVDGFFPCHELCEEVHNSTCTKNIEDSIGYWVPHLHCNFTDDGGKPYYTNDVLRCINGEAPPYGEYLRCVCYYYNLY